MKKAAVGHPYSMKRSLCYNAGRPRITKQEGGRCQRNIRVGQQKGSTICPTIRAVADGVRGRAPLTCPSKGKQQDDAYLAASHIKVI